VDASSAAASQAIPSLQKQIRSFEKQFMKVAVIAASELDPVTWLFAVVGFAPLILMTQLFSWPTRCRIMTLLMSVSTSTLLLAAPARRHNTTTLTIVHIY
jgi:hypothetical protein